MKNLVSIIMPYFKNKEFFLQSIKSVLDQTYGNIEVLIVYDDYNKEDLSYIKNCINKDSRVKIFINDKNKGVAYSRNKAISYATGEYIAFLDCDDYWELEKINLQLNFMLLNNHNFSFTAYNIIDRNEKNIGQIRAKNSLKYKDLLKSCDIGLSTVILKRNLLKDLNFPELKTKEDFVLWLSLAKKSVSLNGFDKILTSWRKSSNSLSSSVIQKLKDAFKVYYIYENKSYIASIIYVIRLSVYALIKKINSYT